MNLQHIIFHALETKQHNSKVRIHARKNELELPDERASDLTVKASKSYRKDRGLAHARFGHGWFPDRLREFYESKIDFHSFSIYGLESLRAELEEEPLSTGGHLFFISFTEDGSPYLMCLLLKDMDGWVINDMEITESHILNLENLHFAALIDIKKWKDIECTSAYISFLKGVKRQEITSYFKKFLCVDDDSFNDPKKNTRSLVEAIKDYCNDYCESQDDIYTARARVNDEIMRKIGNREPITLEGIAPFVDPDNVDRFHEFLQSSNYQIQPEFEPDKGRLKGLTVFSGRGGGINITFESDAIASGKIDFIEADENGSAKLIINQIPPDLLMELRKSKPDSNE